MRNAFISLILLLLAACGSSDTALVQEDEPGSTSDNIACALDDETEFTATCTMQRFYDGNVSRMILGRGDSGYRRFIITDDGQGVKTADGAESAQVRIIADGQVEIAVGRDRYRLPAVIAPQDLARQ